MLKVRKEIQETWINLHALRMEKVKSLLWNNIRRKNGQITYLSYLMNDSIFCIWIVLIQQMKPKIKPFIVEFESLRLKNHGKWQIQRRNTQMAKSKKKKLIPN